MLLFATKLQAQMPVYSSYPSAQAVLFLDFDGHTVNGTSWNSNGPIVCGPANFDAQKITEIFNRIAEDYRPFNVNVTTDSTKYQAAPANKRMRAIFTTSNSWYGNNAGGVAFINSFTWGDNTPCFIFTALLKYNVKNVAEAGSHELGHTLGLSHQAAYDANCAKTSEYNYGVGVGETGWAPIMGAGYYKNFTVWHNGADPYGCASTQSDLSKITNSTNGFGYRIDDHNNDSRKATTTTFTNKKFIVDGIISTTDDVDFFKFTISEKSVFKLSAVPYNVGTGNNGSNLDLQVDILNDKQKLIGSYNPGNALNSFVDTTLNAGTYFLKVDGTGNSYTSEYGSLGSYSLEAAYADLSTLPLRTLALKGIADNNKHAFTWVIDADETVTGQVLEVAENGRPYKAVANLPAGARSYNYLSVSTGSLQYRLSVSFDDGKQHYSNTIALKNKPTFSPEIINNGMLTNALVVSSSAAFSYVIVDFNGRKVASGALGSGRSSININNFTSGVYLLQCTSGEDQYLQKFIKQ